MCKLKYISVVLLVIFVIKGVISSENVSKSSRKKSRDVPAEGTFERPNRLLFSNPTTTESTRESETASEPPIPIIDPTDTGRESVSEQTVTSTTPVTSDHDQDLNSPNVTENDEEDTNTNTQSSDPNKPPIMTDIPSTYQDISRKQAEPGFEDHPGLVAGLTAIREKRSPKNAYILCIGLAGAGKSSTINFLFGRPIAPVGNTVSAKPEIVEYSANISLPQLGIQNSQLRIIDTPGLGSASGVDHDARILATLNNYLKNHEDLKTSLPNVVLIFSNFDDNRMQGPSSKFVRMLKGYDMIHGTLFPLKENPTNIIFVLTRFMSETRKVTKNPKERLDIFSDVIRNYTQFQEPIIITVAENAAEEEELPQIGDNYKLPNKELYPQNLIDKILKNISSIPGTIEHEIFETAFANRTTIEIQKINSGEILDRENEEAKETLVQIQALDFTIEPSEVADALKEADEKIDPDLKKNYPASLQLLQRAFQTRNIKHISQIPTKRSELAKFLQGSHMNPAMVAIFQTAFSIEIPEYEFALVVGHGYDVLADTVIDKTPFDLEDLRFSKLGFMIPDGITAEPVNSEEANVLNFYKDATEYMNERLRELGIQDEIKGESYTAEFSSGNNVIDKATKSQEVLVKSKREIRKFHLTLNERVPFNQEFQNFIREMPEFNISNRDSVSDWENIFQTYGTHIVGSAYGGGEIETMANVKGTELGNLLKGVTSNVRNAIMKLPQNSGYAQELENNSNIEFNIHLNGGDYKFRRLNLAEMELDEIVRNVGQWKDTLGYEAIMLKSKLLLIPLSEVVKPFNNSLAIEMQKAMTVLFQGTLVYVPPPTSATPTKSNSESEGSRPVDNESADIVKLLNENFQKNLAAVRARQAQSDEELLRRLRALMTTTTPRPYYHHPIDTDTDTENSNEEDRSWASRAVTYVESKLAYIPEHLGRTRILELIRNILQHGKYTKDDLSEENLDKWIDLAVEAGTMSTFKGPGFSYDLMQDRMLQISPFQNVETLSADHTNDVDESEKFAPVSVAYPDASDYIKRRTQQITSSKIMVDKKYFNGTLLPGFSFKYLSTIVVEQREWSVKLNQNQLHTLPVTAEFRQMLQNLPLYSTSCASANSWKNLFNTFGTHVVTFAYMGGAIEYVPNANTLAKMKSLDDMLKYIKNIKLEDKGFNFRAIGGDPGIVLGQTNIGSNQRLNLWKASVKRRPVMLQTDIKLHPIHKLFRKVRDELSQDAVKALDDYTKGKLIACDKDIQCGPFGKVVNGYCGCPQDQKMFDCKCQTLVGKVCSLDSWDTCGPNSFCSKVKGAHHGICTCKNRFENNLKGFCYKPLGADCQKSNKCDRDASMTCIYGKCQCVTNLLTYDYDRKECLSKIGEYCGEFDYKGLRFNIQCVSGAYCARLSSPQSQPVNKGICRSRRNY